MPNEIVKDTLYGQGAPEFWSLDENKRIQKLREISPRFAAESPDVQIAFMRRQYERAKELGFITAERPAQPKTQQPPSELTKAASKAWSVLTTPVPDIFTGGAETKSLEHIKQTAKEKQSSPYSKLATGFAVGMTQAGVNLLSPANIALLAATGGMGSAASKVGKIGKLLRVAKAAMSGGFSASLLMDALPEVKEAYEAYKRGDYVEAGSAIARSLVDLGLIVEARKLTGKEAKQPQPRSSAPPSETQAGRAGTATAEALVRSTESAAPATESPATHAPKARAEVAKEIKTSKERASQRQKRSTTPETAESLSQKHGVPPETAQKIMAMSTDNLRQALESLATAPKPKFQAAIKARAKTESLIRDVLASREGQPQPAAKPTSPDVSSVTPQATAVPPTIQAEVPPLSAPAREGTLPPSRATEPSMPAPSQDPSGKTKPARKQKKTVKSEEPAPAGSPHPATSLSHGRKYVVTQKSADLGIDQGENLIFVGSQGGKLHFKTPEGSQVIISTTERHILPYLAESTPQVNTLARNPSGTPQTVSTNRGRAVVAGNVVSIGAARDDEATRKAIEIAGSRYGRVYLESPEGTSVYDSDQLKKAQWDISLVKPIQRIPRTKAIPAMQ